MVQYYIDQNYYVYSKLFTTNNIYKSIDSSYLLIGGGTEYSKGSSMSLYAKDNTTYPGSFILRANDGTNAMSLYGTPAGNLTWGGKKVYGTHNITSGTAAMTAGTSKLETGNIYLQYE